MKTSPMEKRRLAFYEMEARNTELENKLKVATDELESLAAGLILRSQPEEWSYATKLQDRAAKALGKLAPMPLRRKSSWY